MKENEEQEMQEWIKKIEAREEAKRQAKKKQEEEQKKQAEEQNPHTDAPNIVI